jgi:uncharacterized protein
MKRLAIVMLSMLLLAATVLTIAGCSPPTTSVTTSNPPTSPGAGTVAGATEWQWPAQVHFTASGDSGLAKYVSWTSLMEADTDMAIRVIPEADPGTGLQYLPRGDAFISSASKNILASVIEAKEDQAYRNGGAFQMRVVWAHDLANAGFFVRGDSKIKTIYDIGPGTRFSVWNMRPSTLNPPRSLLAWVQVPEKDIVWVDAGDFEGAMRAIAEGRADIAFGFPTSPMLLEVASAPHGIRFVDLNAAADPDGARRWQANDPLYSFAPMASGIKEAQDVWGTVGYILDIADASADPDLVYHTAKWLDDNYDRYKDAYDSNKYMTIDHLTEALKTTFIPVHEGLIKYLDEKGLWTDAHDKRQQENIALLATYREAYDAAIALADSRGITIAPTNPAWLELWETYKVEHKIPKVGEHISLTESGASVVPTAVPQPAPETTPPPKPTTATTTPAVSGGPAVEFVSVTNPARIDSTIRVEVKTAPGAECTIIMTLSEGTVSGFPKDPVKTADAAGNVAWEWVLFSHTPEGETTLEVTATLNGKSATATTHFTVE